MKKKKEYKDIKDFCKHYLGHIKIDKRLYKQLQSFRYTWATKNNDYIDFLGSKLFGVHVIKFSKQDDEHLLEDLLDLEKPMDIQKDIYNVPMMKKEYKIASNIIYQFLMYIAHKFMTSKTLPKDIREKGVREACLIMQYRMFTSLYAPRFQYPCPEHIAVAVYNKLSHSFILKKVDNWQGLFDYRVEICLNRHKVNHKQLVVFDTDNSIRLLSSVQTKLRGNVNELYGVLIDVLEKDEYHTLESSTYIGGENDLEQLKDNTVGTSVYINNVKNIVYSPNDFIDMETLKIVASTFNKIDESDINKFLHCMSDDRFIDRNELLPMIESIMLISFNYLQRTDVNIEDRKYIPKALVNIRFYWSSSKVNNKEMRDIKDKLNKLAYKCTGRKTGWFLITLVISYITYIFLRSLKK